ncbi:MAG: peroxiredoxin [Opitutales bacterium]|jgi:peroxiredoxin Q/BCP
MKTNASYSRKFRLSAVLMGIALTGLVSTACATATEYRAPAAHPVDMATLEVNSPAPLVTATLDDGSTLELATLYAKGPLLVYFYPKSGTPGCTRQACNLRDNFEELTDHGLQVIGVSRDSVKSQTGFRDKQKLPFHLVADNDGVLGDAFGVPRSLGLVYARQSFLIVDGKVAWIDRHATPDTQAQDALAALEALSK